jgi:hypothetical protein
VPDMAKLNMAEPSNLSSPGWMGLNLDKKTKLFLINAIKNGTVVARMVKLEFHFIFYE